MLSITGARTPRFIHTVRWLIAGVLTLALNQAGAHWTEQTELLDWAQRGRLYWCLHYSTHTRPLVDLFLDGGQTLVHGGAFDSAETAEYARQRGLRLMPYVCSRTTTTQEMAKHPQLKDAVLLKPDRSEVLAYNNPVRRYGSLFAPAWPEFVRERTRQIMDRPDVAAVFYDNVFMLDDHHTNAVAAWQTWATAHHVDPGDDMPALRESGPRAAAARAFNAETLVAYYAGLRAFNRQHDPPLLISPNLGSLPGYGPAIMEAGAVDLVFYETMSHPPFENNAYRYKLGLAASHGRPTGILAYLPPQIAAQRGVQTWHEGMHHFFWPASPIAEEFSLAAAEAAACGGVYIPAYNLFPASPITDLADPFHQRIHRAIKQSYTFLRAHEKVFSKARPGSNVGLFHSTTTQIQDRRAQNVEGLARALMAAGIPFEVVVAADLAGKGTSGLDTLIVQNVLYLDEPTAAGILRFVQRGGRVIVSDGCGSFDSLGRPASFESVKRLMEPLRLINRPLAEWKLENFKADRAWYRVAGREGRATLEFPGPAGRYVAQIKMLDENDGTSSFSFAVCGQTIFEGKLDYEDERSHWFITPPLDLAPGDLVTLTVRPHGGEMGRTESVVFSAAGSGLGAPLGKGRVFHSPVKLEERPAGELAGLLCPKLRVPQPQKVTVNVLNVPGEGLQTIHLVNYDFRYEVDQPGVFANDDGTAEARTVLSRPQAVVRKQLRIEHPEKLVEPVLQVHAFATTDCEAGLAVTINGRPAGHIRSGDAKHSGWTELPLDRSLLARENVIELRASGALDNNRWWQLSIDTNTLTGLSFVSADGGKTFKSDDLSQDLKTQTGEFMIRVVDRRLGAPRGDPANLALNPGLEDQRTPHSETKLSVVPCKQLEIVAGGRPKQCLALSPEAPAAWIAGKQRGDSTVYTVPQVGIYTMLALADSRARLEPLRKAHAAASSWTIPPVTTPLRQVMTGWQPYGKGFVADSAEPHGGELCVRCETKPAQPSAGLVQQFDLQQKEPRPICITAWSRAENVSGRRDGDYAIYVDATCADGTVMNGRCAPFATGTHGWEQATLRLSPKAPIRVLRLHLMFRRHAGRVWFDDVELKTEQ